MPLLSNTEDNPKAPKPASQHCDEMSEDLHVDDEDYNPSLDSSSEEEVEMEQNTMERWLYCKNIIPHP